MPYRVFHLPSVVVEVRTFGDWIGRQTVDRDRLLEMSVELAKAHLSSTQVSTQDLPTLIKDIHSMLGALAAAGGRQPVTDLDVEETEATSPEQRNGEPRIVSQDVSAPEFEGLDPWLAARLTRRVAAKLNRAPSVHPTVFRDYIICLEDGAQVKLLRAYIRKRFGMDFIEYRNRWNLPDDYPTAPPSYLEVKRAHAQATGLGSTLRAPKGTPRHKKVKQSQEA